MTHFHGATEEARLKRKNRDLRLLMGEETCMIDVKNGKRRK